MDSTCCVDIIYGIWDLESPIDWSPDLIVYVSKMFSGVLLTVGTILYDKHGTYKMDRSSVEFLNDKYIRPRRLSYKTEDEP